MSVLSSLKTWLGAYESLDSGAALYVDHLGSEPTQYAIIPLPGEKVIEEYLSGKSLRAYPFALQSVESTAADLERIENSGFFESFSDWLESQTDDGDFPSLGSGKTAYEIEALGWGYLYEKGQSDTGIYQIQCLLTYIQDD